MTEHRRPETDLAALRAFCAVAEGGSYATAQAVLGVSQPTISERLTRLEGAFGTRLCECGRRGFGRPGSSPRRPLRQTPLSS